MLFAEPEEPLFLLYHLSNPSKQNSHYKSETYDYGTSKWMNRMYYGINVNANNHKYELWESMSLNYSLRMTSC